MHTFNKSSATVNKSKKPGKRLLETHVPKGLNTFSSNQSKPAPISSEKGARAANRPSSEVDKLSKPMLEAAPDKTSPMIRGILPQSKVVTKVVAVASTVENTAPIVFPNEVPSIDCKPVFIESVAAVAIVEPKVVQSSF